jgi:two-component system sensor histidine kinase PhcS
MMAMAEYQAKLSAKNTELSSTLHRLKDAESELVQSEKLASLGRLSAGIIHEINNPLNYAKTGLYALKGKAGRLAPDLQREYVEILGDVEEGLGRVRDIVDDLREFAHRENSTVDSVNVEDVVQSVLRFLSHDLKERFITVVRNLPEGLTVMANRNKLIQVLVNLLQNSVDALGEKFTANVQTDESPTIWIEGRIEDRKVVLAIRDNGEGIEAEHLGKIFDPFFTTKDVGEGMGLGLSISYRLVEEFQGRIQVRSERGRFCEFSIEFPEPAVAPAAVAKSA